MTAPSVLVYGPQGCGKTRNAERLCKAYGVDKHIDLDDAKGLSDSQLAKGFVVFHYERPEDSRGLKCVSFRTAMRNAR